MDQNNIRVAIYDTMKSEFIADVRYRLKNAYELIKGEDDFLAKLYTNANSLVIIAEDSTDEISCDRRKRQKIDEAK